MRPKYRVLREEPIVGGELPAGGVVVPPVVPEVKASWLDAAPDDVKEILKTNKTLTKFASPWDAAKAYVNLEKVYSGAVKLPGEGAAPEERAEFLKKLGVPDTADGYGSVKDAKLLPEGMAWDEAGEVHARGELHKLGLTPAQYKGVMALYIQTAQGGTDAAMETLGKQARASLVELEGKWGANLRRNVALASRTAVEYGDPDFLAMLDTPIPGLGKDGAAGRLGDHPAYLRFAAKVGNSLLEDSLISGGDLTTDKQSAQAEMDRLRADRKGAYWNRGPGHDEAVARVNQLQSLISSEM